MKALLIADLDQTALKTKKAGFELWKFMLNYFGSRSSFEDEDDFARKTLLPWPCFLQVCDLHVEMAHDINTFAAEHVETFYREYASWFPFVLDAFHQIQDDPRLGLAFATNNVAPAFKHLLEDAGFGDVPLHDSLYTHPYKHKPKPDMIIDHLPKFEEVSVVVVLGDSRADLVCAMAANEVATDATVYGSWAEYGSLRRPLDVHGMHQQDLRMRNERDVLSLPHKMYSLQKKINR